MFNPISFQASSQFDLRKFQLYIIKLWYVPNYSALTKKKLIKLLIQREKSYSISLFD